MKLITWAIMLFACPIIEAKTLRCINSGDSSDQIGFEMADYHDESSINAKITVPGVLNERDHLNLRYTNSSRFGYRNYEGSVISPVNTTAALWINTQYTGATNRFPGQITFTPGKRIALLCRILDI